MEICARGEKRVPGGLGLESRKVGENYVVEVTSIWTANRGRRPQAKIQRSSQGCAIYLSSKSGHILKWSKKRSRNMREAARSSARTIKIRGICTWQVDGARMAVVR